MRLAALLLAAVLPVQASACLLDLSADLDAPCHAAPASAGAAQPPAPEGEVVAVLRPHARPEGLAPHGATSSSAPTDPLLSPRATLFWHVA